MSAFTAAPHALIGDIPLSKGLATKRYCLFGRNLCKNPHGLSVDFGENDTSP